MADRHDDLVEGESVDGAPLAFCRTMRREARALGEGALAGAAATVAMSLAMAFAKGAGLLGEAPPYKIAKRVMRVVRPGSSDRRKAVWASLLHLGIGAASGALFGAAYLRTKGRVPGAAQGTLYGSLIWGASYGKLLPSLLLMPSVSHDRPGRPAAMLASHWVYGAVLGWLMDALARTPTSTARPAPSALAPRKRHA